MSTKVIKEGNVTTEITDMTGGVGGSLNADELMAKMGGQGGRRHDILWPPEYSDSRSTGFRVEQKKWR